MTKFDYELTDYTDGNGLICPNKQPSPRVLRGSDNGVLFTSQAIILGADPYIFTSRLRSCIDQSGYLHRSPDDLTPDAPDDHYGLLAALLYKDIPMYLRIPYPWYFQPGLLYMRGMASWSPLAPLFSPVMALILAFSNLFEDKGNTSNKLLTWTIIQGLQERSILCRLGGMIWTWRMIRIYGNTKEIAKVYYESGHPFLTYWHD